MSRRLSIGLVLTLLTLGAAVTPWPLSTEYLAQAVSAALAGDGLGFVGSGRATFALLPLPRVKFTNASINGPNGALLAKDVQFRATLRIRDLVRGRVAFDDVELAGGRLFVAPDQGTELSPDRMMSALTGLPSLKTVSVKGSSIELQRRAALSEVLSNARLVLHRSFPAGGVDLSGSALWRGETAKLDLRLPDARAFGGRRTDGVALRITNAAATLTLSGSLAGAGGLSFVGEMSLVAPSVKRAAEIFAPGSSLGQIQERLGLSGPVTIGRGEVGWPSVRIELGHDRFDGALTIREDGGLLAARATLATDGVDLASHVSPYIPLIRSWMAGRADGALSFGMSLDLRLSAASLDWGGLHLTDGALGLMVGDGRLDLSVLRAGLASGAVKGRLSVLAEEGRTDVKGQLGVDRVDLSMLSLPSGRPAPLSGILSGTAQAEGNADPEEDLVQRLTGRAALTLSDGAISTEPLKDSWRELTAWPDAATDLRAGRIPIGSAELTASIGGGIGRIVASRFGDSSIRGAVTGEIALADGTARLRAVAAAPDGTPNSPRVAFGIEGPWNAPRVTGSAETAAPAITR